MKGILRLVLAVLLSSASALAQQSSVIAIEHARVIDGTGAPARPLTVLVRDGRIVAVGEQIAIPADAKLIDAQGQTLIPGLFDLHTHTQLATTTASEDDLFKNLKKYVAAGVTSILDYSGAPEGFEPIRHLLKSGAYPAPHFYQALRVSPPGGHGTEEGAGESYEIANVAQAHHVLQEALKYKPDAVKAFTDGWRYGIMPAIPSFSQQTIAAISEEAHKAGIRVFTHTLTVDGSHAAVRGNIDVQVHGIANTFVDESLIRDFKDHGTGYVSTLAVYNTQEYYARYQKALVTPRLLELLEPSSARVAEQSSVFAKFKLDPELVDSTIQRGAALAQNVRTLYRAGVPVGVGTDAGMQGTHHGYATLLEVEYLVDDGLTPLEAIRAGTQVSARLLGVDKDYGTIEAGKVADLVLVSGEPDQKISDVENTRRVWLAGVEQNLPQLLHEIHNDEITPLPLVKADALLYDAEIENGRTNLDTLPYYTSDPAGDHSQLIFTRITRDEAGRDHALSLHASFAARERPFVQLHLPLTRGSILPADLRAYTGVSFDVRGAGAYRLLTALYGKRPAEYPAAGFNANAKWSNVRIDFAQLASKEGAPQPWTGTNANEIVFELSGKPDSTGWLELDNVRFY